MPLYNSAPWIESAVRSILAQTLTDLELILCDNASEDASREICERLAAEDARIRYRRHDRNIGANRNYRSTLEYATGKYFKWMSSSDLYGPTFLADCVAELESKPDVVLAIGNTVLFADVAEDGKIYDGDFALPSADAKERFAKLLTSLQLNNVFNGVMRTSVIRSIGPLGTFGMADVVLMAELALRGKFLLLDKPHFYRRMTPDTATKLKSAQEIQQHLEPKVAQPLLWQAWIFYSALLGAALRSTRFGAERLRVLSYVLRQMIWDRRKLLGDVAQALGRVV
ncbi:MAG TPA: glycosyltransferase family A protein [Steroidobacteraceae bacterium]|nr:glycosyltransferase family A protein [Steroidobacteraceae bacterium]